MSTATLSTKGQLVIPNRLRQALRLRPGDKVSVTMEGHRLVIERAAATKARLVKERGHQLLVAPAGAPPMTPETVKAILADSGEHESRYRASFADAQTALAGITAMRQAQFIRDDLPSARLPGLGSHAEVTDAYLVELAKTHSLKLATLDKVLCQKPWAAGIAENPL